MQDFPHATMREDGQWSKAEGDTWGSWDVTRRVAVGRLCPHYGSEEEGVGGPPSPAMLGRERQGTLIGTRRQWVRAVAEDDRVNVAPSHLPRRRGSDWICDQR